MAKKDFKSVFDVYPESEKLYVCDGQPFLTQRAALNHKRSKDGLTVETVTRLAAKAKPKAKKKTAAQVKKEAAEKATAEKAPTETK